MLYDQDFSIMDLMKPGMSLLFTWAKSNCSLAEGMRCSMEAAESSANLSWFSTRNLTKSCVSSRSSDAQMDGVDCPLSKKHQSQEKSDPFSDPWLSLLWWCLLLWIHLLHSLGASSLEHSTMMACLHLCWRESWLLEHRISTRIYIEI